MKALIILSAVAFLTIFVLVALRMRRKKRRAEWMKLRLEDTARAKLSESFPVFALLPNEVQQRLEGLMHVFIEEKNFEACGGLESVSLAMKHTIAAQACLLIVNRPHDFYQKLRSVLVYPSAYRAKGEDGSHDTRLGESWTTGSVVLAWDSVVSGGKNTEDGHNVSLHEFAHQLDQLDGSGDGVPTLENATAYREWARVFSGAFERFLDRLDRGKRTVLDPYGGTNPAEFFAVATETFFEKPRQLAKKYPDVYRLLKDYYQLDPQEW